MSLKRSAIHDAGLCLTGSGGAMRSLATVCFKMAAPAPLCISQFLLRTMGRGCNARAAACRRAAPPAEVAEGQQVGPSRRWWRLLEWRSKACGASRFGSRSPDAAHAMLRCAC